MLEDKDCSIILVIAGSTSAGGCMDLYAELVQSNMVDAIVATGATIVDMDFFEALGHKHYQANEIPDDDTLRSLYIDRIYDTYIDEEQLQDCDFTIGKIADSLEPRPYSSRAFIREMGKWLSEGNAKKDGSLVQLAYEHDVPIFCPAFIDTSAGFGLVKHQVDAMKRGGHYMMLDAIADFRELTDIKIKAGTTGLLMIGGGVPKNFTQDTVVCAEILGHEDVEVHKYAVQITVADVRDGACSSSTLQEAASWGKVSTAMEQMVFAEATSVLPLLRQRRLAPRRLEEPRKAALRQAVRVRFALVIPAKAGIHLLLVEESGSRQLSGDDEKGVIDESQPNSRAGRGARRLDLARHVVDARRRLRRIPARRNHAGKIPTRRAWRGPGGHRSPDGAVGNRTITTHLMEQPTLFYAIALTLALMGFGGGINYLAGLGLCRLSHRPQPDPVHRQRRSVPADGVRSGFILPARRLPSMPGPNSPRLLGWHLFMH